MRNNIKITIIIVAVMVLARSVVSAGAFDNVGLNARPLGMGQAFTTINGGLNSIDYNPAGLASLRDAELMLSYRDFYDLKLVTQKYIGFAVPERYFNFGFSFHRIGTTNRVDFVDYKEDKYTLSVAGKLKRLLNISAGLNLNFFRVFSDSNASGYGMDAGFQYETLNKRLRLGVFNKNLGDTRISWDTGAKDMLKQHYVFGISLRPKDFLLFAVDYSTLEKLNIGSEVYLFNDIIILRGGIKEVNMASMALGTGLSVNIKNIHLDYALSNHAELGFTHFFTLKLNLKRGFLL